MSGLETAAALATVIGIVASPLFQTFFQSFRNHLKGSSSKALMELHPPLIPSELLALEEAMGNIPLLLHLSKSIDEKIGGLPKFVTQLRKAAYAADDLLDELDYDHLQLKFLDAMATSAAAVQPSTGAGSSSSSQVGRFAPLKMLFTECFAKPSPLQLPPRPHSSSKVTAERIRSTIEDLNRVASRLKDIYPLISESSRTTSGWKGEGSATVTSHRVTTSTVNFSKLHGRDENKKEIVDMLQLNQIHGNEPQISIITIVGLDDNGKTTLTQYIFNDEKLKTLFNFKVWICVSDEYKNEKIIR